VKKPGRERTLQPTAGNENSIKGRFSTAPFALDAGYLDMRLWVDVASGAFAGLVATVPMTVLMGALKGRLPREEHRPLPPREIVANLLRSTDLDRRDERALTWIAHLGFATTTGGIWGALAKELRLESPLGGIAYGLAVWSMSYLGWLPASGLMRPATRQSSGRNVLMISAHVVWGATLATVGKITREQLSRRSPALHLEEDDAAEASSGTNARSSD
jgi:uncharacterized membrane protein YagU involved in acid resistance